MTLTEQRLRALVSYDPDSGIFRWLVDRSRMARAGCVLGSLDGQGRPRAVIDGKDYFLHRLAWLYVHGCWPTHEIDHIDGDKTNNRISNLRDVQHAVNLQNKRAAQKNNKSAGLLGARRVSRNRWIAEIVLDGKATYLGTFESPELAHQAYVEEKRRLHVGCTI